MKLASYVRYIQNTQRAILKFMTIELLTFNCIVFCIITSTLCSNGDGEIRTLDPLLARQVLSQLSYTPIWITYSVYQSYLHRKWA